MEAKKPIGWVLIVLGLGLVLWALWSSFQMFSGKTAAPEIFNEEPAQISKAPAGKSNDLQAQAQEILNQTVQEQLKAFLPAHSLPKLLNLLSWSIFAGIAIFGGGQIAVIGAKLL